MDEEQRWTEKIRRRELAAFMPYARRMWSYSVTNCIKPVDTKVIREDFGKSLRTGQYAGIIGIVYWNLIAIGTAAVYLLLDHSWGIQNAF